MFKKSKKKLYALLMVVASLVLGAVPAFAEGVADQAVVGAFESASQDIIATLGAIAPFGIAVMAIFLAWKFGKKLFNRVAS